MTTRTFSRIMLASATAAVIGVTAGCAASDPLDPGGDSSSIVVASANFPENVVLGEIYAQALEAAGYAVERQLNIGAREVYYQQIESCAASVVPEYNQALLAFLDSDATASGTEEVDAALTKVLPKGVSILDSSQAQDNNAVVVTRATAEKYELSSIVDFNGTSEGWVFGGPPEWVNRSDGMAGLEAVYGTTFAEYRVLDYAGPITISALDKGDIQAALLFSTLPQIVANDYVVLDDPDNVLGVNNVTPLICDKAIDAKAIGILNSISTALTTESLTQMNSDYSLDKMDASQVAEKWLSAEGLN